MIIVDSKAYYSVSEIIRACLRVWPAGESFGRVLHTVETRPGLGFEVKGENMSNPGQDRFADVDSLADVLGWTEERKAAVLAVLKVQRPYPDHIGGRALPISKAGQEANRERRRLARERGEPVPNEPEIWLFRGRADTAEPVNIIRLGDARV